MVSSLNKLQSDVLREFFARERRFFLSGGGALAGFYLGHRETEDLDFFTGPGVELASAERALLAALEACGAVGRREVAAPDFVRYAVTRDAEKTLVDLVIDRAPMIDPHKPEVDGIRLDTLREIAANKICTLVGRTETKDLRDLRALLAHGLDLRKAIADAAIKEGGADAGTLAWVLESFAPPPGEPEELRQYRRELAKELRAISFTEAPK